MSSDAFTFLAILLLALALLIFAFAIVYNVGENARDKRRQQDDYHPSPSPMSGASPSSGAPASSSPAPRIRWGQVEDLYEDEPSPAARGVVWGQEGLEPRGPEPAWNPLRPPVVPVEQEKCPTCRRRFSDTTVPVVRCANPSCQTYIHQECLNETGGSCPICHGTRFVAATV